MRFKIIKRCQIEFEIEAHSIEEAKKILKAGTPKEIYLHNLFGDGVNVARLTIPIFK